MLLNFHHQTLIFSVIRKFIWSFFQRCNDFAYLLTYSPSLSWFCMPEDIRLPSGNWISLVFWVMPFWNIRNIFLALLNLVIWLFATAQWSGSLEVNSIARSENLANTDWSFWGFGIFLWVLSFCGSGLTGIRCQCYQWAFRSGHDSQNIQSSPLIHTDWNLTLGNTAICYVRCSPGDLQLGMWCFHYAVLYHVQRVSNPFSKAIRHESSLTHA